MLVAVEVVVDEHHAPSSALYTGGTSPSNRRCAVADPSVGDGMYTLAIQRHHLVDGARCVRTQTTSSGRSSPLT